MIRDPCLIEVVRLMRKADILDWINLECKQLNAFVFCSHIQCVIKEKHVPFQPEINVMLFKFLLMNGPKCAPSMHICIVPKIPKSNDHFSIVRSTYCFV